MEAVEQLILHPSPAPGQPCPRGPLQNQLKAVSLPPPLLLITGNKPGPAHRNRTTSYSAGNKRP